MATFTNTDPNWAWWQFSATINWGDGSVGDTEAGLVDGVDGTFTVTQCGRICFKGRKVNLSHVFAGQKVGVTQVGERIWLVTFMRYDLGYFDDETCRLEPIDNPFRPKVLPMSSE